MQMFLILPHDSRRGTQTDGSHFYPDGEHSSFRVPECFLLWPQGSCIVSGFGLFCLPSLVLFDKKPLLRQSSGTCHSPAFTRKCYFLFPFHYIYCYGEFLLEIYWPNYITSKMGSKLLKLSCYRLESSASSGICFPWLYLRRPLLEHCKPTGFPRGRLQDRNWVFSGGCLLLSRKMCVYSVCFLWFSFIKSAC